MTVGSPVLQTPPPAPYRPHVPRLPKNFRVDSVSTELLQPRGYVATGPDTALPSSFEAHFVLGVPEASVTIEVFVGDGGPVVVDLSVRCKAQAPITTSNLRQVLVDQLLHKAVEAATVPAGTRAAWLTSVPPVVREMAISVSGQSHEQTLTAQERSRIQFDDDARTAAQIWSEAVASGSNRPGMAVANEMNRSRAQASRYIRRARALGLLPAVEPRRKA